MNDLMRVETYSDAVFAIAATLLVLEIKVPSVGVQAPPADLWRALADLWPSYLAFVISFGIILLVWVHHHSALRLLSKTSNAFLYANGFLLLTVTFIPFPTALLAKYIETPLASVAVAFYACSSLATNLGFAVWFGAMLKPVYLLKPEVVAEHVRTTWMRIRAGTLAYAFAGIIGWWLPPVGLGVIILITVLWIVMSIRHYAS